MRFRISGILTNGIAEFTKPPKHCANAGRDHSMVLTRHGSVMVTGRNNHGQLGDGTKIDKSVFVTVLSGGCVAIAAGDYHSMVRVRSVCVCVFVCVCAAGEGGPHG